jgi:hypothetical protein
MNPRKIDMLDGARLAFAQGGPDGFKLVLLTNPIKTISHDKFAEVRWSAENKPLKYYQAPLLIKKNGFPTLRNYIASANRSSWEAKFASKFRSRRKPLDPNIAEEIIQVFDLQVVSGDPDLFISTYVDALPYPPSKIDCDREYTYFTLLNKLPSSNKI